MRGFGEVELVQSLLPEWTLALLLAVTRLGDLPVLVGLACVVYWYDREHRGAYALAIVIGGVALLAGLKAIFALPRPPTELHYIATGTTGFPSGHALGATVVYGALALTFRDAWSRRARFLAAGALVVAISFSRIGLGVHYAADVIAGIAVGVAYLLVVRRLADGDPMRAFAGAAAIGVLAFIASVLFGPTPYAECVGGVCVDRDAAIALGATAGAFVAWTSIDGSRWLRLDTATPSMAIAVGALSGLAVIGYALAPRSAALALGAGVLFAGVVLAPCFARRISASRRVTLGR